MLIEHLKSQLGERCRKNPRYSVRSFARSLNIHSATLSALLNGRRPLTAKTAMKILDQLDLDMATRKQLLNATLEHTENTNPEYRLLQDDIVEAMCEWHYFAILSLLQTKNCKSTVAWISKELNIGTGLVIEALDRLQRLGLLRRDGSRLMPTYKRITTSNDIPSSALKRAHREYLDKALYSLEHHSVNDRDITGVTMAISKRKLNEAKRMIKTFRRELCDFLENDNQDAVYRLNIQLFPLRK